MEIERKYLVNELPADLDSFESYEIEQAYLCTAPVVRIRKGGDHYTLTYKGSGMMAHEEYNLPLDRASYYHLLTKADGKVITKRRYKIPFTGVDGKNYLIELDIFSSPDPTLILAEVEFESVEEANSFTPPSWFKEDVTFDKKYHNSVMACGE